MRQEEALKRGEWGAWINRKLEEKAIDVQKTGGAGVARTIALSPATGVLSGVQALSGFLSLLGGGLEFWTEDVFGFDAGLGEASNFFGNIGGVIQIAKENMTGTSNETAQIINAVGDGIGQFAVSLALAVATGGAGALAMFIGSAGVQAAGSAYNSAYREALALGVSDEAARALASADASLYGIASTITNAIPGLSLFGGAANQAANTISRAAVAAAVKKLSSRPEVLRRIALGGIGEGIQEVSEDALGNMAQVLAWNAAGGDPQRRELLLRQLAEGNQDAWYEALLNFAGGAGAGGVGGKIVQSLDLRRFTQEGANRERAWKAFETGITEDMAKERKYLGSSGNAADLSQAQLEAAARGERILDEGGDGRTGVDPVRTDTRLTVSPLDAAQELRRRGLKVPDDAVTPAPEPAAPKPGPAAPGAPAPAPAAPKTIMDGRPAIDKDRNPIVPVATGVSADGIAKLDAAEIEKFVAANPDLIKIFLGTAGFAPSVQNISRLFPGTGFEAAIDSLKDPMVRAEFMREVIKAAEKTKAFTPPTDLDALTPAEKSRLDQIDETIFDDAKRPTGAALAALLKERSELLMRDMYGTAEADLEPLSPYDQKVLDRLKKTLGDPKLDPKRREKLERQLKTLDRRSRSAKTWTAPTLPAVTADPTAKPLTDNQRERLKELEERP